MGVCSKERRERWVLLKRKGDTSEVYEHIKFASSRW